MTKFILSIVLITVVLSWPKFVFSRSQVYHSEYTSLKKCHITESSDRDPKAEIDYFDSECPALDGYRIFHNGGDSRSWLEIESRQFGFDTRHDSQFFPGQFWFVSGEKLEWRYKRQRLIALIYRMSGSHPENPKQLVNKLLIIRIEGGKACVLASTDSNEQSRKIADQEISCP